MTKKQEKNKKTVALTTKTLEKLLAIDAWHTLESREQQTYASAIEYAVDWAQKAFFSKKGVTLPTIEDVPQEHFINKRTVKLRDGFMSELNVVCGRLKIAFSKTKIRDVVDPVRYCVDLYYNELKKRGAITIDGKAVAPA